MKDSKLSGNEIKSTTRAWKAYIYINCTMFYEKINSFCVICEVKNS